MTTPDTEHGTTPVHATAAPAARRRNRRMLRYFLMQLFPVTAGILLALLIDGVLEVRRQDQLVAEAHAALAAEIRDNARDLDNALPSMDAFMASLQKHMADIDAILATGTDPGGRPQFGMVLPKLNRASWESAERTGALEYMDYEQVQKYAEVYMGQERVMDGYDDLTRRFPALGPVGVLLASENPAGQPEDLRDARKPIAELLVAVGSHRVMVYGLKSQYRKIQCSPDPCAPENAPESAAPAR